MHFSLFVAFIFCFPTFIYSQSCPFVSYKKVFYENDSTMYPNNTIDAVNIASDSAYFVGGSQIAKIDWKGNRVWNNVQNNNFFGADALPYIAPDGNYYLILNNYNFMRIDANESVIWQKQLLDTNCNCNPVVKHIVQTTDGGFIITGSKSMLDTSFFRNRIYVVKTNAIGDTLWTKTIAETTSDNDGYYSQETADGGYLVVAYIRSITNTQEDFRIGVLKLNANGQEQWFKTIPKPIYYGAKIKGLKTNEGNCVIVASIDSVLVATYFVKINDNGDAITDTVYNNRKFNGGLIQLQSGDLLIGMEDSLSRIDGTTKAILWNKAFIGNVGENIPVNSIKTTCDNGLVIGGNSAIYQYSSDCCGSMINFYNFKSYLFKVDSTYQDIAMTGIMEIKHISENNMFISPNPFSTQTTILFDKELTNATLKINDILGREVKSIHFSGVQFIIEKAEMKTGVYFIQVVDENKRYFIKKIVIQ